MKRFSLFFSLVLLSLNSCNQAGGPLTYGPSGNISHTATQWIVPTLGTTFVLQDSLTFSTDTFHVVSVGETVGGKTNVFAALDPLNTTDTSFCHIEANGDFEIGTAENNDSSGFIIQKIFWEAFPTGSGTPALLFPSLDSIDDFGDRFVESDSITLIGHETVKVPAGTFQTIHVRQREVDDRFINGTPEFLDTFQTDYWFAPAIGFYVKTATLDFQTSFISTSSNELILYKPK